MVKIAVTLSDNGNVMDFIDYPYSMNQKGSNLIFVEKPTGFSIHTMYEWTVRPEDNMLVHIATNLTPDEESQKSNTELTNLVIAQGTDIEQIKQSITVLTNAQLDKVSTEASDKQEETK